MIPQAVMRPEKSLLYEVKLYRRGFDSRTRHRSKGENILAM